MEDASSSLQHEDLLISLRGLLNEERIKLWEPPYSENASALEELSQKYANNLKREREVVLNGLLELQQHAVGRALANNEFKESGLATFRVRASIPNDRMRQFNIQKRLEVQGSELIAAVANEIAPISESRIKLIVNGKVIVPTKSLQEQGIKNGVQVLALIMAGSVEDLQMEDGLYREMKATRDDAALLTMADSDMFNSDSAYMKLEDQHGHTINLPDSERRALMVGLALHEHGRTAIRNEDYRLALVLLLEADRHFSECNTEVLGTVDNWALLQLDVAWCYLCLQSLSAATDAAQRLERAERALKKSYGENCERLIALKGTDANERTLIMRMHLLQAIVAYHQNQRSRAKQLIQKAETELNALRVNENDVTALVELGWSRGQARTGLRATGGNPDAAHYYLTDLQQQRNQAREDAKKQRLQQSLGKTVDGQWVSREFVKLLVGMGYPRRLAVAALQNSNNHVSEAVRIIQEQPELLSSAISASESVSSLDDPGDSVIVQEEVLARLVSLGYDQETAHAALQQLDNNMDAAIDLLTRGGTLPGPDESTEHAGASTSSSSAAHKALKKTIKEEHKKHTEREDALKRLNEAIGGDEDDHLDSTLQQEESFLAQYKSLIL